MSSFVAHPDCPEALRRIAVARGFDPGLYPITTEGDGGRVVWPSELGDVPSQDDVDAEIVVIVLEREARAAEPTVDDVTKAIMVLAEGDDTVAKRISDKANEIAQARSSS